MTPQQWIMRRGRAAGLPFDIYADSVNGNNANSGTSPAAAKQTIAGAMAVLGAGKKLGLVRGSKWRETFTFQHANLTIGVAGNAADPMPILDGRDVVTGTWTQPDAGTYPDVWSISWTRSQAATTGSAWLNLWADNEFVRAATSLADLQTNGGAHYVSRTTTTTTVSIKSTTNPNSNGVVYEISKRGWAFNGHSTSLGSAAPANQLVNGPIECVGYVEHYNALSGGPGQSKKMLLSDGNVHHSVTEGDLTEDVLASRIIPGIAGSMFVVYRVVGTGLSHIFRRCLALAPTGTTRTSTNSAFYTHASTPATSDAMTVDQCVTQGCGLTGDCSALTVTNSYFDEAVLPAIGAASTNATVTVNRVQIQDRTSLAAGAMAFRCLSTTPVITVQNLCAKIITGSGMQIIGLPSTPPSVTNSALIVGSTGITGVSGQPASLTLNNSIVIAPNFRVLNLLASPYSGNFNVFQGIGDSQPLFGINGATSSSFANWQTISGGQDAQSVWLKGSDQTAGNANAFWLGVATNANAGPADGDWRINPSAKVYNAAGTALFGTFADGTTPVTAAGPQEHWNFNTRAVVSGPPTSLLTLPATKAEERAYVNDPAAWDFYA